MQGEKVSIFSNIEYWKSVSPLDPSWLLDGIKSQPTNPKARSPAAPTSRRLMAMHFWARSSGPVHSQTGLEDDALCPHKYDISSKSLKGWLLKWGICLKCTREDFWICRFWSNERVRRHLMKIKVFTLTQVTTQFNKIHSFPNSCIVKSVHLSKLPNTILEASPSTSEFHPSNFCKSGQNFQLWRYSFNLAMKWSRHHFPSLDSVTEFQSLWPSAACNQTTNLSETFWLSSNLLNFCRSLKRRTFEIITFQQRVGESMHTLPGSAAQYVWSLFKWVHVVGIVLYSWEGGCNDCDDDNKDDDGDDDGGDNVDGDTLDGSGVDVAIAS